MNQSTETSGPVLDVLQKIMAMPETQRTALRNAWDALDGLVPVQKGFELANSQGEIDSLASFEEWLDTTRKLANRPRIAALRQVLAKEDDEDYRAKIEAEISAIKNQDRKFAVELAVTDFAYEHPVLVVLALVGVGVGLFRITKGLWTLMF